jgi:hypothetical protein
VAARPTQELGTVTLQRSQLAQVLSHTEALEWRRRSETYAQTSPPPPLAGSAQEAERRARRGSAA